MDINRNERRIGQKKENNNHRSLTPPPPLVLKAGRYLTTLILMGLAIHLILPQLASVESSLQVIKAMILWAVLLAALAQSVSYLGTGYLTHSVVAIVNQHLSVSRGVIIALAASSIGMLAGGTLGNAAATYRWVKKYGISAEGSGLAGTLPTIFNNATLMALAIAGILHLLLAHKLSSVQFSIFLLILTLLGLGLLAISWGKGHRTVFTRMIVRITSYFARILHVSYNPAPTEASIGRMFTALEMLRKGGWKRPAMGASISTGFDMLTLYFFFIAAGYAIRPEILLVGYGLPLIFGKMAFLLPGGVGVVESTMAALYTGLGVPGSIAVVVILGYRLFSFWIPTLIGFPIAFYLQGHETTRVFAHF
jgi:glycosyltransferase 2 family protein